MIIQREIIACLVLEIARRTTGSVQGLRVAQDDAFASFVNNILQK